MYSYAYHIKRQLGNLQQSALQSRLYSNLMHQTLSFQPMEIKLSVEHTSYDL